MRARGSLLVTAALSSLATATAAPVVACDGTALAIQEGLWGVSTATLQNRTELASGGPNFILNGDFSYAANGTDVNGVDVMMGLINDPAILDYQPYAKALVKDWTASGGGVNTYAVWGGRVCSGDGLIPQWSPIAQDAGASQSCVYFGNSYDWSWNSPDPLVFDPNGYAQGIINIFPFEGGYGDFANPVTLSQTVQGLTPGERYRLQFFQGPEKGNSTFPVTGIAALEITGYERVYFYVQGEIGGYYRTLDFVALQTAHEVRFLNWGHVWIEGPQNNYNCYPWGENCATEWGMDDVILTQCSGGGGGNTTAANCTATARVTPHVYGSSKGRGVKAGHFTYRLTVRCPVPKRAGERAGATPLPKLADFALQLPEHLYAQTKSLRVKPKALALPSPVVDEGGLLTWTVPNPPRQFSFKILLTPTACIPAPELTGLLCIDNDCQSVPLVKQPKMNC